jgi:tetratricopeptide (TPR) repeat protein
LHLRELQSLVRRLGGSWCRPGEAASPDLLILGADALCAADDALLLQAREVIRETELWEQLGLLDAEPVARRWYTPALIADVLGISLAQVRRWHKLGLIQAARQVHRLPLFTFEEIAVCRTLRELLATGVAEAELRRRLAQLAERLPGIERPLAQLQLIVDGRNWLVRQKGSWIEPSGQRVFPFEEGQEDPESSEPAPSIVAWPSPPSAQALAEQAEAYDAEGNTAAAIDLYRAALAAGGPQAEWNTQLADALYRSGDLAAARERYFVALELDSELLAARLSLGCVLVDMQQAELAEATFRGVLAIFAEHPDAHYHLGRLLDAQGRRVEATSHWQRFAELAPESPWLDLARQRLAVTATENDERSD